MLLRRARYENRASFLTFIAHQGQRPSEAAVERAVQGLFSRNPFSKYLFSRPLGKGVEKRRKSVISESEAVFEKQYFSSAKHDISIHTSRITREILKTHISADGLLHTLTFDWHLRDVITGTADIHPQIASQLAFGLQIEERSDRLSAAQPDVEIRLHAIGDECLKNEARFAFGLEATNIFPQLRVSLAWLVDLLRHESPSRIALVWLIHESLTFSRFEKTNSLAVRLELSCLGQVQADVLRELRCEHPVVFHLGT